MMSRLQIAVTGMIMMLSLGAWAQTPDSSSILSCFLLSSQSDRVDNSSRIILDSCKKAIQDYRDGLCKTATDGDAYQLKNCNLYANPNPYNYGTVICSKFVAKKDKIKNDCYHEAVADFDFTAEPAISVENVCDKKSDISAENSCLQETMQKAANTYSADLAKAKTEKISDLADKAEQYLGKTIGLSDTKNSVKPDTSGGQK